jgi:hypothetical protein
MTNLSTLTDSYGIYTYKDDLIYYKVENFANWRHRELSVQKDWLLNAYIKKLNEEILTERPIFTPNIFGGKSAQGDQDIVSEGNDTKSLDNATEPKPETSEQDVSDDWEKERWDNLLLNKMNTARTHSFCVVVLYDKAPFWRVFSEREIESIKYDKNGAPIGCHVSWTLELPKSQGIFINFDEDLTFYNRDKPEANQSALFVPFGVPKGNRLGEYDIETLWSLAIDLRYIALDITWNSAKTSGFLFLKYGDALKTGDSQSIVNVMDIIGSNRAIGAKKGALEDIVAIHPENCQFSIDAMISKLKLFASSARLPLTFFVGEKETGGVFTEGFTDEAKINKKKKYVFGQFKPYIKDLVKMRWGIDIEDVECYIEEEEKESFEFGEEEKDQDDKSKGFGQN